MENFNSHHLISFHANCQFHSTFPFSLFKMKKDISRLYVILHFNLCNVRNFSFFERSKSGWIRKRLSSPLFYKQDDTIFLLTHFWLFMLIFRLLLGHIHKTTYLNNKLLCQNRKIHMKRMRVFELYYACLLIHEIDISSARTSRLPGHASKDDIAWFTPCYLFLLSWMPSQPAQVRDNFMYVASEARWVLP